MSETQDNKKPQFTIKDSSATPAKSNSNWKGFGAAVKSAGPTYNVCPNGESEIESLLRDAARYRWLREHASPGLFSTAFAAVGLYSWKTPSQIDEGVDVAMKIYPPREYKP